MTADIAARLNLTSPSATTRQLQYDGQFGDAIGQQIGSAKLSVDTEWQISPREICRVTA